MAPKVSVPDLISALIIAATFTGAAPGIAQAQQKFPIKPVRIVVGFPNARHQLLGLDI